MVIIITNCACTESHVQELTQLASSVEITWPWAIFVGAEGGLKSRENQPTDCAFGLLH